MWLVVWLLCNRVHAWSSGYVCIQLCGWSSGYYVCSGGVWLVIWLCVYSAVWLVVWLLRVWWGAWLVGTYVVRVHAWLLACKQVPNPGRHHKDGPKGRLAELLTRRIMRTVLKQALRQMMVSVRTDPRQVRERRDDSASVSSRAL